MMYTVALAVWTTPASFFLRNYAGAIQMRPGLEWEA